MSSPPRWSFLVIAVTLSACAAPGEDGDASEEGTAASTGAESTKTLLEHPYAPGSGYRASIGVDERGAVWFADGATRTLRLADEGSRYLYTAPTPAWGLAGPWFGGGATFVLQSGSALDGRHQDVVRLSPGQDAERVATGFLYAMTTDAHGAAFLGGMYLHGLEAVERDAGALGLFRVDSGGGIRRLGTIPKIDPTLELGFCRIPKIVTTETHAAALVDCGGSGAVVAVSKDGGEARVFLKKANWTISDIAAGRGDTLYAVQYENKAGRQWPVVEVDLDSGAVKEVGSAFLGSVAHRGGVVFMGDYDGNVWRRTSDGRSKKIASKLGRLIQLEASPIGVVALTRGDTSWRVVEIRDGGR